MEETLHTARRNEKGELKEEDEIKHDIRDGA